jgi:threonine dehydrogenase-like Zn-dependent dehydrogenase
VLRAPLVLGHEAAGVIADGPPQGERVAIDPAIPDST